MVWIISFIWTAVLNIFVFKHSVENEVGINVIHTPGLNTRVSPFCRHKGKQHSLYAKTTPGLQNIPYIRVFYNSVLSSQIVHLITLHMGISICAAQQF